jgi:hypothetical protein
MSLPPFSGFISRLVRTGAAQAERIPALRPHTQARGEFVRYIYDGKTGQMFHERIKLYRACLMKCNKPTYSNQVN